MNTARQALASRLAQTDPVAIRERIALLQVNLLELARRREQAEHDAVYFSRTEFNKRASWRESTGI